MKKETIILDLAGVVLNLNLERDTLALNTAGLPDFATILRTPSIKKTILSFLNGLSDESTFIRDIRPFCHKNVTNTDIRWAMDAVLDDIPSTRLELISNLRSHYNIYLLSNIYPRAWQYAVKKMNDSGFQPEDCFDQCFLSYEMQLAKPDPRIFAKVISETQLTPSETYFFDDTQENIDEGLRHGLKSFLVPMNQLDEVLMKTIDP